jgi:NAD(P)-dependent dehydrogenase (short-subunit alcohol dehydrogenase family)
MKTLAMEYGEYGIRANCVAPTNVTPVTFPR